MCTGYSGGGDALSPAGASVAARERALARREALIRAQAGPHPPSILRT